MLKKITILTVAFILLYKPAFGGLSPQAVGVKPLGMGGAFRAVADDNSALNFNPGGLTQSIKYSVEALYYWSELSEEFPKKTYHISIVDTKTSGIGGGFSFTREKLSQGGRKDSFIVALAEQYRSYLHIGISAKYFRLEGTDNDSFFAGDIGIIIKPWQQYLSVGIVSHNLFATGSEDTYPQLGLGLATHLSNAITLAADTIKDLDSNGKANFQYNFGGEVLMREQLGLRGGYSRDQHSAGNYYSLGLGWYAPRLTINYGFQQGLGDLNLRAQSVSFIIYF